MILGVMHDEVGSRHLGALEDRPLAVFSPGFAEELSDLFAARIKHRPPGLSC
jgi:hypothetical protein